MSRSFGALALAAGILVATLPPTASGAVHRLKGDVVGDANGTVSMKVVVRGGDPKRVKDFKWRNLDGECLGSPDGEKSGQKSSSTRVEFNGFFRAAGNLGPTSSYDISGFVKRRGRKIANGSVLIYYGSGFCRAPDDATSPRGGGKFTAT